MSDYEQRQRMLQSLWNIQELLTDIRDEVVDEEVLEDDG